MRPPTGNPITQTKHGPYNAVDYSAKPDPIFYAPEDVTFYAYLLNAGDAGNNLQVVGAHGRHGFCHLETSFIKPGQRVAKGEPLGRMGFTGKTSPAGPGGRHLHWVINRNGTYVYPLDLVTELFEEDEDMKLNKGQVMRLYQLLRGNEGDEKGVGYYTDKELDEVQHAMLNSDEYKNRVVISKQEYEELKRKSGGAVDPTLADKARKYDAIREALR